MNYHFALNARYLALVEAAALDGVPETFEVVSPSASRVKVRER